MHIVIDTPLKVKQLTYIFSSWKSFLDIPAIEPLLTFHVALNRQCGVAVKYHIKHVHITKYMRIVLYDAGTLLHS